MVKPLTAEEAYRAGRADYSTASLAASDFSGSHSVFHDTLVKLWQERIASGELPPLLEKAS